MIRISQIYDSFIESEEFNRSGQTPEQKLSEDKFRQYLEKYLDGEILKKAETLYQNSLIEYSSNGWYHGFRYATQLMNECSKNVL